MTRPNLDARSILILFAGCALPWLGCYDFFTRGEAREALAVQHIHLNGDWILPRGYDGAIASKPPLFHWSAAALSVLAGRLTELTIRMPSALFSLLTVLVFLWLSSRRLGREGRVLFVVFLLFSFEWLRNTLTARVDMVHSATLACGLMAGFEAARRGSVGLWALCSLLVALSTIAKGPVALVLSTGVLGAWYLFAQRTPRHLVGLAVSLAGAALLSSAWYMLAFEEAPKEFSNRFWYENVQRFTGTIREEPHEHSVFYLMGVFLLGWLPWSAVFLGTAWFHRPKILDWIKSARRSADPALTFSLFAACSIFVFYSIPSSKRGVYLLSSYPFVALALALALQGSYDRFRRWLEPAAVAGCLAVFAGQVFVMPFVASWHSQRSLASLIENRLGGDHRVFSYDDEFYGASYYAERRFHRIPEPDENKPPIVDPEPGDLLVCMDDARAEATALMAARGLGMRELERSTLGREEVILHVLEPDATPSPRYRESGQP